MAPSAELIVAPADAQKNDGIRDLKEMDLLRESMNRPHGTAVPAGWKFEDIKGDLIKSGELIPAKEAQRRAAMLVNPAFDARTTAFTTDTIYAGYQLILPGEIASAHRHVAFAMRWGIEGDETYTSVAGHKMSLAAGDLILTPSWEWHYHGNDGTKPEIWLDSLDIPAANYAKLNFSLPYHTPKVPDADSPESPFKFPWAGTKAILDKTDDAHVTHHFKYKDLSGVSRTLGAQAERVKAGTSTVMKCDTFSYIYSHRLGSGHSTITPQRPGNGKNEATVIHWSPKDVFVVPAWSEVVHTADAGEDAYLFAFNDRPQMQSLGFNRVMLEDGSFGMTEWA